MTPVKSEFTVCNVRGEALGLMYDGFFKPEMVKLNDVQEVQGGLKEILKTDDPLPPAVHANYVMPDRQTGELLVEMLAISIGINNRTLPLEGTTLISIIPMVRVKDSSKVFLLLITVAVKAPGVAV